VLGQFEVKVGDPVRIGAFTTHIAGALRKVPGETVAFATLAPRVYLRLGDLDQTGLLQQGSLARYRRLYRFPDGTDVPALVEKHRARLDALRLSATTVQERKEDLGQSMRNLHHFLNLVGFIALLLGGVGIASAIHVHVKQKLPTVAVLRCLGASVSSAFGIYLVQALALGLVGAALGTVAGVSFQQLLPRIVADFVPVEVDARVSWPAILEAAAIGFLVCLLFALLPLAAVRRVSPLQVLRVAYEPARRRDPLQLATVALLVLTVFAFALGHTRRWQDGLGFAGGLLIAFGALAAMGQIAVRTARRIRLAGWPFVIRQGFASVHRPHNRTLLLVVSLGLGTFLLLTLHLTQASLLKEWISGRESGRPNAILFDIQTDQRGPVADLVRAQGLPVVDEAPIVTMRLTRIKDREVQAILGDPASKLPGWALRREFRSTFSDRLRDSEQLVAGAWIDHVDPAQELIPISVEDGIARELGVGLNDELLWDLQGVPLRTRIASLRKVDWRRVQPNFFVVFPRGPLDDAPAFHVLVTRVESAEDSARLQRALVAAFPNVSAIDITLVLRTLDQILEKIAFVIRFMALFTVVTGVVVLVAAVVSGRFQRAKESVLLRVLGASRRQVLRILMVEYATLGLLASGTGVVLAVAANAALATWVFEIPFHLPWAAPLTAIASVTSLTVLTGWLASRGVTRQPPLEILRSE
ncbi:MAG: FtsX-like permease family protein, partial [Verrucomicrobiales bacterium]|nr:FtsX-like permease family protein [Verrucomicrobiales bacterium]